MSGQIKEEENTTGNNHTRLARKPRPGAHQPQPGPQSRSARHAGVDVDIPMMAEGVRGQVEQRDGQLPTASEHQRAEARLCLVPEALDAEEPSGRAQQLPSRSTALVLDATVYSRRYRQRWPHGRDDKAEESHHAAAGRIHGGIGSASGYTLIDIAIKDMLWITHGTNSWHAPPFVYCFLT
jgi:hypothetical protein